MLLVSSDNCLLKILRIVVRLSVLSCVVFVYEKLQIAIRYLETDSLSPTQLDS